MTTLITAGFVEPPWAMERALLGMDGWPLNVGLQAGARGEDDGALDALLDAGACGFKIHEDYGAYPELIDRVLRFADAHDVSVSLHTDGLHESAELEDTVAAIAGRTVHAYHVEGTGGGHVPDLLGLVREANILCSSTTPTVPYGVNAGVEGWPMIILNHGASYAVAERPWSWSPSASTRPRWPPRVRSTSSARSASSTPIRRAWAGSWRRSGDRSSSPTRCGPGGRPSAGQGHPGLPAPAADPTDSTERVLRYLAKATIEPAITHGISAHVGSLAPGRLADIVLWKPAYFGVKPELVLKGGFRAWAPRRRGECHGQAGRADALPGGLGRDGPGGRRRLR